MLGSLQLQSFCPRSGHANTSAHSVASLPKRICIVLSGVMRSMQCAAALASQVKSSLTMAQADLRGVSCSLDHTSRPRRPLSLGVRLMPNHLLYAGRITIAIAAIGLFAAEIHSALDAYSFSERQYDLSDMWYYTAEERVLDGFGYLATGFSALLITAHRSSIRTGGLVMLPIALLLVFASTIRTADREHECKLFKGIWESSNFECYTNYGPVAF